MDILEGSYATYKRATANFINWVRNASRRKLSVLSEQNTLSRIEEAVVEICERVQSIGDTAISNSLRDSLPSALHSCRKAIEIRTKVGLLYKKSKSDSSSNSSHKHFISCLQKWYNRLIDILKPATYDASPVTESSDSTLKIMFVNFLHYDDDSGDTEETEKSAQSSSIDQTPSDVPDLQSNDDIFEKDLQLTLLCLLLDMEENMKRVVECWIGVKNGTETVTTATVVTTAAIKLVQGLEAKLQLSYPAFTDFETMFSGFLKYLPEGMIDNIHDTAEQANKIYTQKKSTIYVEGALLWELKTMSQVLDSLTTAMPKDKGVGIQVVDGYFGAPFEEDLNPIKDMGTNVCTFICQELPKYYSMYIHQGTLVCMNRMPGTPVYRYFIDLITKYFDTKVVSLTLSFACACWMKSVMALQGGGYLGKCIYISKMVLSDICNRLDECIKNGNVLEADTFLGGELQKVSVEWKRLLKDVYIPYCHVNPYLAGALTLDIIFQYMELGCQSLHITSRFRAFGHLYNALLDRKVLSESIAFLDTILEIYDQLIFFPSKPEHGKFADTYLLSSHITVLGLSAMKQGKAHPATGGNKVRRSMNAKDLSMIFRVLIEQDYTCLFTRNTASVSNTDTKKRHNDEVYLESEHVLDLLAKLARYEQLNSRVLSRDILTMNDYYKTTYEMLIDVLNIRDRYQDFLVSPQMPGYSDHWIRNYALENTLMNPLILMLDYLNDDCTQFDLVGYTTRTTEIDDPILRPKLLSDTGEAKILQLVLKQCNLIAYSLAMIFDQDTVEKKLYYSFVSASYIYDEFGTKTIQDTINDSDQSDTMKFPTYITTSQHIDHLSDITDFSTAFSKCMDILEANRGPLSNEDKFTIKYLVRKFPEVLAQVCYSQECLSMFLLICASSDTNADLVEWLIHMGALQYQQIGMLPNTCGKMPLHGAVTAGLIDIVKLVVEYDHLVSLNVATLNEGDTPLHIAIRKNYVEIAEYLWFKGADLFGKLPHEEATSATRQKWKKKYNEKSAYAKTISQHKSRNPELKIQSEQKIELVNRTLAMLKLEQKNDYNNSSSSKSNKKKMTNSKSNDSTMANSNTVLNKAAGSVVSTLCNRPGCTSTNETKTCANCRKVKYCGYECQRADWSVHKKVCKTK